MKGHKAVFTATLAAVLFGISAPVSKLLLAEIPPTLMAALLYLGAGAGMLAVHFIKKVRHKERMEANISRRDIPFVIGMIVLDVLAPICMMTGLSMTTSANVSLLTNFEIVATSLIALLLFKETVGRRMWLAVFLITLSSMILSIEDISSFSFSAGSLFVVLACLCWGFENNCTRMLSLKDPLQIVVIKGFGSGAGSLIIAGILGQFSTSLLYIIFTLLLGFVAYGLSIYFYILAQRELGAARTSAYYAAAPFFGVLLSFIIFGQTVTGSFVLALVIMTAGAFMAAVEHHRHIHIHDEVTHEHRHSHEDGHHTHVHEFETPGDHSHLHTHERTEHVHKHTPDMHHDHRH